MDLADVRAAVITRWESAADLDSVVLNWKARALAALRGLPRHQQVVRDATVPMSCWWLNMGASERRLIAVATGADTTDRMPKRPLPLNPQVLALSVRAVRRTDQVTKQIEEWRAWLLTIGEVGSGLIHRFARHATVPALYASLADSWSPPAFVDCLGGVVAQSWFDINA